LGCWGGILEYFGQPISIVVIISDSSSIYTTVAATRWSK